MPNYMMITKNPIGECICTTFCDVYPERDREIAENAMGLYVEIYRREYDSEMCLETYIREY